ncbi:MAG: MerR family transcriptional regulator [Gammaproteobacteria bacterium]
MAQWYVKDLSKLTHISVQTLHHYDRINLLVPSVRLSNGYRLYSEKDLLKLQQIIALKFFGFELAQIKTLLDTEVNMIDHFVDQSQCLEAKAKSLLEASQTLNKVINDCSHDKSIPWETILKLIEVYRMTQQLEKTWAGKVFNSEELKQYASFEQELKTRFTETELNTVTQQWSELLDEVSRNLKKDPTSDYGIAMGQRCMDWVNKVYGKKYVGLRNAIWVKGFEKGAVDADGAPSPEAFSWLDKAISAYYRGRIMAVLSLVEKQSDPVVLKEWNELMEDMHGDEREPTDSIIQAIMKDDKVSRAAKDWVKLHVK